MCIYVCLYIYTYIHMNFLVVILAHSCPPTPLDAQGMWFQAHASQVLVLQWDAAIEDFAPTETPGIPQDQLRRLVDAVRRFEFDDGLAAYPMDDHEPWRDLTRFVDCGVLAVNICVCVCICMTGFVCMYMGEKRYMCMYIYIHTYLCVNIYIYIYIYMHEHMYI